MVTAQVEIIYPEIFSYSCSLNTCLASIRCPLNFIDSLSQIPYILRKYNNKIVMKTFKALERIFQFVQVQAKTMNQVNSILLKINIHLPFSLIHFYVISAGHVRRFPFISGRPGFFPDFLCPALCCLYDGSDLFNIFRQ